MFKALLPERFVKNAYVVDYSDLYRRGYRGLIFDIDNTLVPHDAPATAKAALLVKRLRKKGFRVEIVSNNEEPRVKSFAEGVGCDYVYKAGKPKSRGYLEAVMDAQLVCFGPVVESVYVIALIALIGEQIQEETVAA